MTHTSLILLHSTCKTSAELKQNLHFWWKIFRFGRIFFLHLDLQACPNSSRIRTVEIFFIPKSNELEHSAGVENFPQHLDLFVCQISAEMKKLEDFPLPKICNFFIFFFSELHDLEHSAEATFSRNSKIPIIYFSGHRSVPSLRKIREPFLQSVGRSVGRPVGRSLAHY